MAVKLLFFAGSARATSLNKRLARAAARLAEEQGAEVTFVDLKDYSMPVYCGDLEENEGVPEAARKLAGIVRAHDGVFIASPEYNSSLTPLLKNTLDWVSRLRSDEKPPRTPWHGRAFAVGATSMGAMGGIRVIQTMVGLLTNGYQVQVIPNTVAVPRGHEALGEGGDINEPQVEAVLMGAMKALIAAASHIREKA